MSPDLFFWYALAFKVAMTATIVVVVSVAAERSGPFIAALIAALPTAASATYIILAVEHPPAFVAVIATLRTRAYQKNGSGDMIRRHCPTPGMTRHGLRAFGSAHARLSFTSIGGPLLSVW